MLSVLACGMSACLHGQDTREGPSLASIAGTVRDAHGEPVIGATVAVVRQELGYHRVLAVDGGGAFTFAELAPGTYRVTINTDGSDEPIRVDVSLRAGEKRELPVVGNRVASSRTTVQVIAEPGEIAKAQIKQQESQRLLGIIPNFHTSYIWNAAPMSSKQKFALTLRSNTDPFNLLMIATLAGLEQKHNTFPGYGQGAQGYAKRFSAGFADTMVSKMIGRSILPSVLHQDPRYFYRGSGSFRNRAVYALTSAVITRGDNGKRQPNYSQVLGSFAATGISNLYRAPSDRTVNLTFRNGLIMTGGTAIQNLIREFISRKLTPNVPAFANGKP
jgi:hypothetical protein